MHSQLLYVHDCLIVRNLMHVLWWHVTVEVCPAQLADNLHRLFMVLMVGIFLCELVKKKTEDTISTSVLLANFGEWGPRSREVVACHQPCLCPQSVPLYEYSSSYSVFESLNLAGSYQIDSLLTILMQSLCQVCVCDLSMVWFMASNNSSLQQFQNEERKCSFWQGFCIRSKYSIIAFLKMRL